MTATRNSPNRRPPSACEGLLHAWLRSWGLLRQVQEPYFARFGISASQWGVLRVLQRAELQGQIGLPLNVVSERLLVQPPSLTGVVGRLERHGLVQRSPSAKDLRVRQLALTRRGRTLTAKVLKGHAARVESLFAALEPGEQETLLGLLKRLEFHFKKMVEVSPEQRNGN
jgi:DNA-binding MarR family transcriptional regulator